MMNPAFWGGAFFTALGGFLLSDAIKSYQKFITSKSWPSVQGTIIKSEVLRFDNRSSAYSFMVTYQYELNGKEYQNNRVALWTISSEEHCNRLLEQFPQGKSVPIYYPPNEPSKPILVTGPPWHNKKYSDIILGSLGTLMGILLMILAYFNIIGN